MRPLPVTQGRTSRADVWPLARISGLLTGVDYEAVCRYVSSIEQQEIVAILGALDAKGAVHARTRASLSSLFRTLLHQLMTAQIRVHDLDLSALEEAAQPTRQEVNREAIHGSLLPQPAL